MFRLSPRFLPSFSTVKLHTLIYPNNQPWNLLILHGLLGSHKNFRSLMKNPLLSSLTNIHLIDNRNHGDSPHTPTHSYPLMATDIKNYILHHNLHNIILMGHSMGGGAVYKFSELYPDMQDRVKQLVVIDMPLRIKDRSVNQRILDRLLGIDLKRGKEQIMREIEGIDGDKTVTGFLKTNLREGDGGLSWVSNIPVLRENYEGIVGETLKGMTEWVNDADILYGDRSQTCTREECERLREVYRNFDVRENVHEIKGAGHWLHFENPKGFMEVVLGIVRKNVEGK